MTGEFTMELRGLGETGLIVSPIGLGLAALGRPGYINLGHATDLAHEYDARAMEERAHAVLDAAWSSGVRYFDAARSYGRAEEFLSNWLRTRKIAPGTVTIGSKWGYTYTADWQVQADHHEVKDHGLSTLQRQFAESRELLGDYLGLYQIHSATLESGVLGDRAVLEELARLRSTGMKIGLTLSGPAQAKTQLRALDITIGGDRLFDCVQATWNLLERSAGVALEVAHNAGLGVIVKEVLANGRLTSRNQDPSFAPKRRLLEEIAQSFDTTIDALAFAVALAQPFADTVLSGATTATQLRSNLAALSVELSADVAERLEQVVETPLEYWSARGKLPWN
jgi:aryl-alcohol dehydrogenase-like predicted oxidoreductase